jgi:flagellar L-ring protein precursor FlgH
MKTKISIPICAVFAAFTLLGAVAATAQSLWHDDTSRLMFADKRGVGIGDILTITIQENSSANKNNETKTERSSSLTAAITSFFYPGALAKGGSMPALAYNSDHKHDGSGSINNSETMIAQIAVQVIDVLPNRNLVVEGKRETAFAGEHQTITLHGIVRPEDVGSDNTVLSYNVADATIHIIGKGAVTDSTNKGWFNRVWDKVNPF